MERLQSARVWLAGGTLVGLVIVAVSWVVFVGPQLSSASDLKDEAAATRQTNEQLRRKVDSLEFKSTKLPTYTSSLEKALAALPYDSGLPAFTRQLNRQGRANGVTVDSVTVGGITPVAGVGAPATTGSASPSAGSSTTTAAGAFSMQVTLQSNGPLHGQLAFLKQVQSGPRRALITSEQVTPGTGSKRASVDGQASLTTQLTIFSAPQTPVQIRELKKLLAGDLGD